MLSNKKTTSQNSRSAHRNVLSYNLIEKKDVKIIINAQKTGLGPPWTLKHFGKTCFVFSLVYITPYESVKHRPQALTLRHSFNKAA